MTTPDFLVAPWAHQDSCSVSASLVAAGWASSLTPHDLRWWFCVPKMTFSRFENEELMGSCTSFGADHLFHFYLWPCGANGNTKRCCMGSCSSSELSTNLPHGSPCRNGALLLSPGVRTLNLSRAGRFLLSGRFSLSGQILRGKLECEPSYHAVLTSTSQDFGSGPSSREASFTNTRLTLLTFLERVSSGHRVQNQALVLWRG